MCNPTWIAAVEYLEICGIIVGQILVGVLGDWCVWADRYGDIADQRRLGWVDDGG